MNIKSRKILRFLGVLYAIVLLFVAAFTASAQTNPPAPPTGAGVTSLWDTVQNIFDVHNTNSLINAQELNLTPIALWDSASQKPGGGVKLDWWVSDQQGVSFGYSEYSNRKSYWNFGYQARTVFKQLEVALGTGISQNTDLNLGNVRLYLEPTLTYKLGFVKAVDLRVTGGCQVISEGKPSPFIGLTLRFSR